MARKRARNRCCGRVRTTLYCPDCGKPQTQNDIDGLMRYVHGMVSKSQGWLDNAKASEVNRPWQVEKAQERLDKWMGWCKALLKLVKKAKN